jgi:hypothetical protein
VHELQGIAQTEGGRLLRVLFLRIGRVSTYPRAAQLLSLNQMYFRQIISGTNDNKAAGSVIPTILLRERGPDSTTPAANKASAGKQAVDSGAVCLPQA